jgi:DNA repair ATPase RecN
VAAHAEHHLCVRKAVGADDRVVTQFDALQQRPERLAEISAMLGLPEAAAEELMAAAAGQP